MVLIDCVDILASLFDRVLVPFAVRDELLHLSAPKKVKDWILQPRPWLEMAAVERLQPLRGLHKGEAEALQLAIERKVSAVLMDDMDGRAAARQLGLVPIFTIALLQRGAEKGLIDLPSAIAKLRQTSFFVPQEILDGALQRDAQRRKKKT
jgi:predicted nucleic acid-binding protein